MCETLTNTLFDDIINLFVALEHAGHARDMMKSVKLDDWYGIVIVSGDGLLYEVNIISC